MDLPRYSPHHSPSPQSLPPRMRNSEPPPYSPESHSTDIISAPASPAPSILSVAALGDRSTNDAQVTYTVGRKKTRPLIKSGDLLAHLRILGAFRRLREEVRTFKSPPSRDSDGPVPRGDEAWRVFLARAVHRFELWVKRVVRDVRPPGRSGMSSTEIPPLDVLMVWHTYLLNPRIYYEDCTRMYPGLLSRGSFPLHEVAAWIDPETLRPQPPSQARSFRFESMTGLPFLVSEDFSSTDEVSVECPSCSRPLAVRWFNQEGTGYGQDGFQKACPQCNLVVNKLTVGIAKFCHDISKIVKKELKESLAGMLLEPLTGTPANEFKIFNSNFIKRLPLRKGEVFDPIKYAKEVLEWKMEGVEGVVRRAFLGSVKTSSTNPAGVNRILSFYRASGAFSIDLVKAVQRQERFTEKMVFMNWTDPERFEHDDSPILRCVNQYHAFLNVMANNPTEFLVPTLSIDLAWHTHQLFHESYRKNTLDLVRTFVDHDDNVEQQSLAMAYEKTVNLWKASYGIPYSVCGCPPPSQTNAIPSLSRLFSRKGKGKADPTANPRPDLLSREIMDADETHPSEHPAVTLVCHTLTDSLRDERRSTLAKRLDDERKAVTAGKADQWAELVLNRNDRPEHDVSFLTEQTEPGTLVHWEHLGLGECIMGIGKAGLCSGGNHKHRAPVDWIDAGWGASEPLQALPVGTLPWAF